MRQTGNYARRQHLMSEAVKHRVSAIRAQLETEYAGLKAEREELVKNNEQQSARIAALIKTLDHAEKKLAEQTSQIARLKNELESERDAHSKAEQRIREARQELITVEHRLDEPCPEPCGGA